MVINHGDYMTEKLHTEIEMKEKWLNKSKSGKGVYLFLSDDIVMIGSLNTLRKFVNEEIDGCPLTPKLSEDK